MAENKYCAFRWAASGGHLNLLKYLITHASDETRQDMLTISGDGALNNAVIRAAQNGHLEVLKYLVEAIVPADRLQELIESRSFNMAFEEAVNNGHLEVMEYLVAHCAPNNRQAMLNVHSLHFALAARGGHLRVLKYLALHASDQLQNMINHGNYLAFREAADQGHLDVMDYLIGKVSAVELERMLSNNNYIAFQNAAQAGDIGIFNYLVNTLTSDEQRRAMIFATENNHAKSGPYVYRPTGVFLRAAEHGHLAILKCLIRIAPAELLQKIITAKKDCEESDHEIFPLYEIFPLAAHNGHLEVLEYLISLVPMDKLPEIIAADDYKASREAANYGHLAVLKLLALKVPDILQAMIANNDYHAFRVSGQYEYLDVLKYLASKIAPDEQQAMIAAGNYEAFRYAAQSGYLKVMKYLTKELVPADRLQAMIAADKYSAFHIAASRGHFEMLKYLVSIVSADKLPEMIAANEHSAFRYAAKFDRLELAHYLMQYLVQSPASFAAVEGYGLPEADRYIHAWIADKLAALVTQKAQFKQEHPEEVFDIQDANEVNLLGTVARNLIRRKDQASFDQLRFLLEIPAVLQHNHQVNHNELVKMAIIERNQAAALLLLEIPEVRKLAEENNFYLKDVYSGYLSEVVSIIAPLTDTLDLSQTKFLSGSNHVNFLDILKAISANVVKIDLHNLKLHTIIPPAINAANRAASIDLPQIVTVYFSHSEIEQMSPLQRQFLINLFPNIKCPVFLDDRGHSLGATVREGQIVEGSLITSINYARRIGFDVKPPSLQAQAAFFIKQSKLPIPDSAISETHKAIIKKS